MAEITLTSEGDALALLTDLLEGRSEVTEPPTIEFAGWPEFTIHLPNTPVDGSISPTMMTAFLGYQEAINRSFSLISSGDSDLRSLKEIDRRYLEFRVKVDKGSSDYRVVLSEALNKIGLKAVTKMTPKQVVIVVLGIASIVGGTVCFNHFVSERAEERKAEIDAERDTRVTEILADEHASLIEMNREALALSTEHMKILAQAMAEHPVLGQIEEMTDIARTRIVRAVGDEGGGTVQGVTMSAEAAHDIAKSERRRSEPEVLTGVFRVMKVDAAFEEGFRVTFWDPSTGLEVTAALRDALLTEQGRVAIQSAEWQRSLVTVQIRGRRIGGKIVDGVILRADPHTAE